MRSAESSSSLESFPPFFIVNFICFSGYYGFTMIKKNIAVESQTWKGLNALKEPGDSFDNVVMKLLEYWWKNQSEGEL